MDGQGTTWRRNITKNFNRLSRVHKRYRRQTDDRRTDDDSEREREFPFAKNRYGVINSGAFRPINAKLGKCRPTMTYRLLHMGQLLWKPEVEL